MDNDRMKGAGHKVKGTAKELAGKITGDKKLETEGTVEKAGGTVQNTVGGVKDSFKNS